MVAALVAELVHPTSALDIGLIRDEANVAAPRREPQVELAWALALPGPYLDWLLFPGELKLEARDGHTTTPHPATDAKVVAESRLEWSARMEDMMDQEGPGQ
ncbi:hypothetical protein H5410_031302 [Solanum commersonii]|uniref:Uncharacterized protein n=1 Tax=Solanum commersonii TaxID=4109 RepID=A0A9J5YLB1_SOLCO|nr:hypothetical protein H5410_031302 [Solanum commersonii]